MSATASSVEIGGVMIPAYPLENAVSIVAGHTDDEGEYFAMQMVSWVPAADVPAISVVVITLDTPQADGVVNYTFLALCKSMFLQVHDKPQTRLIYGHCSNFSEGTVDRPIPIGALVKFPSMRHYLVAQPHLVQALRASLDPAGEGAIGAASAKSSCLRPLEGAGDQVEDATGKTKGMSIVDSDGGQHPTRNKTNLHQWERDLWCTYRNTNAGKHNYSISSEVTLQPDNYLGMPFEQGDRQAVDRHSAFISCGLMSRIEKLLVLGESGKLKLLLVGSVLTDNYEPGEFLLRGANLLQALATFIQQCGFGGGVEEIVNGLASVLFRCISEGFGLSY